MRIKWSQWNRNGMIRCGERELNDIMKWVQQFGLEASKMIKASGKAHALYARKIHDESGKPVEIRLYSETYMDDDELDRIDHELPHDILYVAHKL